MNEIPDDLLQMSTSFKVSIYIHNDDEETESMNFLRHLTSFDKPINIMRLRERKPNDQPNRYYSDSNIRSILEKHNIDTSKIEIYYET